mgnify:CR=1 FL=1
MSLLKHYWLTAISILGILLVRVLRLPSNIINPDCSIFLTAGQLVLADARQYLERAKISRLTALRLSGCNVGYPVTKRFFEIGTAEGLAEGEALILAQSENDGT